MSDTRERRAPDHPPDEEFSPEYLAMLVVCGGQVRESDWAVLPPALAERRFSDSEPNAKPQQPRR